MRRHGLDILERKVRDVAALPAVGLATFQRDVLESEVPHEGLGQADELETHVGRVAAHHVDRRAVCEEQREV